MCDKQWTAVGLDENKERGETRLRDVRIPISLGTRVGDEE